MSASTVDVMDRLEKRERDIEHAARRRERVYEEVLNTPSGREVLADVIFKICGSLTPSGPSTEFEQGKREVGLTLLDLCARFAPSKAAELIQERNKR